MHVNLDAILNFVGGLKRFNPLPKYPGIERDIAVVVPANIPASDLNLAIRKAGGSLLERISLFDIYQGEQIKNGYKSMAFALKFQAADRTLTDEEVNDVYQKIQSILEEKFNAELRA